jgi:hypothetical protein
MFYCICVVILQVQIVMCLVQGDVRELRESVIQVALDNMVESLHTTDPNEEAVLGEDMAQQPSDDDRAGEANPGDSMARSAAGDELLEPIQDLPLHDNTNTFTDLRSHEAHKGVAVFDPDELMQLEPAFTEDGEEFNDMLC